MPAVEIQGILCLYRDLLKGEPILYENLPKENQVFTIEKHPFTDDELIAIANKELPKDQWTSIQKNWVDRQEKIFNTGIYAYIGGELKFIPGAYWCYINFWTLEHGDKPEYREDDRLFFLFHEYLRLETECLALTRLKGRRQGATSIGTFFMWFVAGRKEHQLCGLTSFDDAAAQAAFQKMFMFGFKSLLPCFQADFDSSSENFIRFVKHDKRKKGIGAVKQEGLNSYCDYKTNVITSYDSGRQSYNVPDEGGKRKKLNINSYWSRLYKTFLIGSKKVGFGYLPTTVGSKTEGGEEYRLFWNNSNQYEIDKTTGKTVGVNTVNRCVQYFVPATHCYAGCIDKFGNSIVEDPIQPVLSNEGKWISEGSKTIILRERLRLKGEQLMEHRRDYPLDIHDAFAFELGICEFNEERIIAQLRELEENPVFLRKCRLYREKVIKKNIYTGRDESWDEIKFMDDDSAGWLLLEPPNKENLYDHHGILKPLNTMRYSIGVDTIKSGFAINGSTATICVFKKSLLVEGEEKGLYPVALWLGKPRLMNHLYEEVLKACIWYGCKVNFEIDAGTSFYDYFLEKDSHPFLEWTPRIAINLAQKNQKIKPGTESANPFQMAMELEVAKKYFDGTLIDGYNGNVHRIKFPIMLQQALEYDHSDRTKSDVIISLMMALLPCFGSTDYLHEQEKRKRPVLPQYKIKMAS